MMRAAVRNFPWVNTVLVVVGVLVALILMPLVGSSIAFLQEAYDEKYPVARAKLAKVEYLTPAEVKFQIWVARQRNCETLQMVAMTGHNPLAMYNATTLGREDGEKPISYPVGVTILSKPWILSPVYGPRLMLWGYYDCSGRLVKSQILDELMVP